MTSNITNTLYDNIRLVWPEVNWQRQKRIGSAVVDVSVSSMMQAAREAVVENEDDLSHITARFDGS
jgi:hypothetical protein